MVLLSKATQQCWTPIFYSWVYVLLESTRCTFWSRDTALSWTPESPNLAFLLKPTLLSKISQPPSVPMQQDHKQLHLEGLWLCFYSKVTESTKSNLDLTAFMPAAVGRWGTKRATCGTPPISVAPFFFPESVGGALWMQSCPVAPADLAACGSNQNYPLIDYLLGSRKAIMDLILNLLKVFKACFWVLLRRADSNVLQGGVT